MLDKGLEQDGRVAVATLPVLREPSGEACQEMGSEVGGMDPGQDQEARVVDHLMQVVPALLQGPANEAVAGRDLPRRGAKADRGQQVVATDNEIADLCPRQRLVPQVVMAFDQLVPERGVLPRFDATKHQLAQTAHGRGERFLRVRSRGQSRTPVTVAVSLERRRQLEKAVTLHAQHGHAARHVLPPTVGSPPAEQVAHVAGKLSSGLGGVRRNQAPEQIHLFSAEEAATVAMRNRDLGVHAENIGDGSQCVQTLGLCSRPTTPADPDKSPSNTAKLQTSRGFIDTMPAWQRFWEPGSLCARAS